jgi:nucleotide-binding universal stress UspA family protein
VANREHATVTAVAVEAHLPHYGATVGEVEEERLVEEQAARRWLAAALAYADEHGVTLATEIRAGHPTQELVRACGCP